MKCLCAARIDELADSNEPAIIQKKDDHSPRAGANNNAQPLNESTSKVVDEADESILQVDNFTEEEMHYDPVNVSINAPDDEFNLDDNESSGDEGVPEDKFPEDFLIDATSVATTESEVAFHQPESTLCAKGKGADKQHDFRNDPEVWKWVQKLVSEEIRNSQKTTTPAKGSNSSPVAKSPSDTTVYALPLHRINKNRPINVMDRMVNKDLARSYNLLNVDPVESQVTQGIEEIRLNLPNIAGVGRLPTDRRVESDDAIPGPSTQQDLAAEARKRGNEAITEAEKFKASVAPLPGMNNMQYFSTEAMDDEFFHITSHIDNSLKEKIEKGEFVDLEKLLARPYQQIQNAQRLELITKDGNTYFAPVNDRGGKIGNVKRWEQAFRVYAAIYSKANPSRSAEIWQYVHVIHTAASAYAWDNVM